MPFNIPNATSGATAEQLAQAAPDSVDISTMVQAGSNNVSGGSVGPIGTSSASVQVQSGVVAIGAVQKSFNASVLAVTNNSSGNPRFDLVIYRNSVGLMVLPGTPAAAPFTAFPVPVASTDALLAALYVGSTGTAVISAAEIIDKRASAKMSLDLFDPGAIGPSQYASATVAQTLTNKRITKRTAASVAPSNTLVVATDNYDYVHLTGVTGYASSAFSVATQGSPVDGDELRFSITDAGTVQLLNFDAAYFEASPGGVELPTATVVSTRMDLKFNWNTEDSRWRLVGGTPGPLVVQQDLSTVGGPNPSPGTAISLPTSPSASVIFNPTLSVGVWMMSIALCATGEATGGTKISAAVTGGTASYAFLSTGGVPTGGFIKGTGVIGNDTAAMISFTTCITVAQPGTVLVQASAGTGSGTPAIAASDTTVASGTVTSQVLCWKIG